MCNIQSKVVGECVLVKSGNIVKKEATTANVYCRLLHDMAVSRFDRWPKLPKLTHLGVLLPCMSVKYLFTVTRWDLPKKFVKSFAESLDLYRFLMNSIRMEAQAHKWGLGKGLSIYSGSNFVYTWLEALPLITQWLSCDTHIRSYIESEWIIWLQCYELLKYWNIVLKHCTWSLEILRYWLWVDYLAAVIWIIKILKHRIETLNLTEFPIVLRNKLYCTGRWGLLCQPKSTVTPTGSCASSWDNRK